MKHTRNTDQPKTILRWNGQEIQYNERDREFVHEMLGHQLKLNNVGVIQIRETHKVDDWQCVIVSLPKSKDFYETEPGQLELQDLIDGAKPEQHCFMLNYTAEEFSALNQKRNSRLTKANVFNLFEGYQPDESDPEPAPEPEPTLA